MIVEAPRLLPCTWVSATAQPPLGARESKIGTRYAIPRLSAMMNHSIYSADRTTHLKIVVVALLAGLAVAGLAISSHVSPPA